MRILRHVWEDISQGENIDLYLTVVSAIVVTLLNILGVASSQSIAPLTLAVLALLAISSLVSRHKLNSAFRQLGQQELKIYEWQNQRYFQDLICLLDQVQTKQAKLIEFSTHTIQSPLLHELAFRGFQIKLLLTHPANTPNAYQRERVENAVRELLRLREYHKNPSSFKIRCYKQTAALRGRKIGDQLISVGWYTYGTQQIACSDMPDYIKAIRGPQEIDGHTNPMVNADPSTHDGKVLEGLFDRVFDDLWVTATPIEEAVTGLSQENAEEGD